MKILLLKTLIAIVILVLAPLATSKVDVLLNNTNYTFAQTPRLAEVLNPIALNEPWYWPASALFRENSSKSVTLRKEVIALLVDESRADSSNKGDYQLLINQLKKWELADRISITINFELARISEHHNPAFDEGKYRLNLQTRPESVYVFGALDKAGEIEYQNNTCVSELMDDYHKNRSATSNLADSNFVYIISPEGMIKKSPIAYWNKECELIQPGSAIYVPIKESQFSDSSANINQKIAALAFNRVTAQ